MKVGISLLKGVEEQVRSGTLITELLGVVLISHYCSPTSALPIVLEIGSNTQSSAH